VTRKRGSDRHPARLRSVPAGKAGRERDAEHLRAVPDPPRVLPTLVPGDDEDPEVDPWEVLEMSLPAETMVMMQRQGISVQDVLDGKVPGLDPDEIVATAMSETESYTGPWTPFAF
jgi:hypothetical protein